MNSLQFLATPLLTLIALLCVYYIVWRKSFSRKGSKIQEALWAVWRKSFSRNGSKIKQAPWAGGAWPIMGHLHLLAWGGLPHITLGAMADKYGPVFMMQLVMRQAIVVSNAEIAKECFTTNDRILATRPSSIAVKLMGYNYAMFAFGPYGPYWREIRKTVLLKLLSTRRLESLKHVWEDEISTSVKELYELCASKTKTHGPVSVDMKQWFGDLTLNVSFKLVSGKRYFGANTDFTEHESRRCQKAVRDFFRLMGLFVVSDFLPFLEWLDLQGYEKEMKKVAREVDGIVQGWLDEHKRKRQSSETTCDQDFMDVMLTILQDSKLSNSDYDADTINKATCFIVILGGSDTTMVTMTWALSTLLNNSHILKKAQDELEFHVGKGRQVEESDIKNLTYLQAIIKETLRLYPAAPLLLPHEATEDCTIAGHHVPAGTRLIVNAWKIQRDPLVWPNPNEFQPERFLNNDVDVKGQHFELIPFGSGRRACPGLSLGLQVVSLGLARLLHGFELSIPSGSKVDMTETAGLVTSKATPLEVFITPRLSPHTYVE